MLYSLIMDANTKAQLTRIITVIYNMTTLDEFEEQDRTMIIEMIEAMLDDLVTDGKVLPLIDYIKLYCNVADHESDYQRLANLLSERG